MSGIRKDKKKSKNKFSSIGQAGIFILDKVRGKNNDKEERTRLIPFGDNSSRGKKKSTTKNTKKKNNINGSSTKTTTRSSFSTRNILVMLLLITTGIIIYCYHYDIISTKFIFSKTSKDNDNNNNNGTSSVSDSSSTTKMKKENTTKDGDNDDDDLLLQEEKEEGVEEKEKVVDDEQDGEEEAVVEEEEELANVVEVVAEEQQQEEVVEEEEEELENVVDVVAEEEQEEEEEEVETLEEKQEKEEEEEFEEILDSIKEEDETTTTTEEVVTITKEIINDVSIILSTNSPGAPPNQNPYPICRFIEDALKSLNNLKGLDISTIPIYIAIDGPIEGTSLPDRIKFENCQTTLKTSYRGQQNVNVLTSANYLYLVGNLKRTMDLVTTKYVYVLYQEFKFSSISMIEHDKLIEAMELLPNQLRCIKFRTNIHEEDESQCTEGSYATNPYIETSNGLSFFQSNQFFDSNHLTTKEYYDTILDALGVFTRVRIKDPMGKVSSSNCTYWGQSYLGTDPKEYQIEKQK